MSKNFLIENIAIKKKIRRIKIYENTVFKKKKNNDFLEIRGS